MSSSRERVLDSAWELVRRDGAEALTMVDVARDAGVSRQMVYVHFSNRAGLFTAMARHHDERSGFLRALDETARLEPRPALEAFLRAWLAYVPEILPVARALYAAALTGAEGGAAWHDRMDALRDGLRGRLRKVDLAEGWELDAATDWLYASVHTSVWDHLVVERGWDPRHFTELTIRAVLDELVAS